MIRLFWLSAVIIIAIFSVAAAAKEVAIVSFEAAIANSNYAKAQLKQLEETPSFKKQFQQYQQIKKELSEQREKIKANELVWSEADKQKHFKKMEDKLKELNHIGTGLDREKSVVDRRIQDKIEPKIKEIVPKLIKEHKIKVLLDSRAVHFVDKKYNITKELIDRLNAMKFNKMAAPHWCCWCSMSLVNVL